MNTIIKLIKVEDVITKETEDKREYVRVTFLTEDENKLNSKAKISMSVNQWNDLRKNMNVSYNSEIEEIETKTPISIEFEKDGKTISKNPKPLAELKSGTFKGYSYNYLEINVGVLIQNNFVSKEEFKKDYSKLFSNETKKKPNKSNQIKENDQIEIQFVNNSNVDQHDTFSDEAIIWD